jgi:ketosteroid isomerase-like protein
MNMPRLHIRCVPALLVALIATVRAQEGSTLPGGHTGGASRQKAQYEAELRSQVDSVFERWQEAIEHRSAVRATDIYERDALLEFDSGSQLRGEGAIRFYYERWLPRVRAPRFVINAVDVHRDSAQVEGVLTVEVPLPDSGSYVHSASLRFVLRLDATDRYKIRRQSGGDLSSLSAFGQAPRTLAPGAGDSIRVKFTDVSGAGIAGQRVTFDLFCGHGTVTPTTVTTDADGVAAAWLVAGPNRHAMRVEAVAEALPEAPVVLTISPGVP